MPSGAQVATSTIERVFEEVLSGSEYDYVSASPLARWLGAALDFVGMVLDRWLPAPTEGVSRLIYGVALATLVLAGILVLVRWARGRPAVGSRFRDGPVAIRDARDAAAWRRWAAVAASEGRLRAAATGLYQAVVLHLEAQGALDRRDWKTAGDYLQELESDDPLRRRLADFLGCFVEVAFGPDEPTADAVDALDRFATRLGCPT